MALQIWLPLTKDLKQQGLSNVTVINNGATYSSTGGKLGGCYTFNRTIPNYLKIDNPLTIATNGVSMSFWMKIAANGSVNDQVVHIGNGSGWNNNRFTCFIRGGTSKLIFCCGDGTNSTQYNCISSALTLNQWTHVACTYTAGHMKIYLNGILDKDYTTSIVPSFANTSYIGVGAAPNAGEPATIDINDVRIYDHCLSSMEVKQLSQSLILHYPLNRQGWGQENLAKNTGNRAPDASSQVEFRAFNIGTLPIIEGETVTVSFDLKMEIGTAVTNDTPYLYIYNTNYKGPHGKWIAFTNKKATPIIPVGNYAVGDVIEQRVHFTTTTASSFDAGSRTEDWIEFYSNYDTENKITITNIKIEKGSIATPWCPNSADELATTMGLNSTTEYDCSGFCNNGTRTGIFTWTSDTPKYAVSQVFNGTDNAIQTPSLPTMITDKNYTIAVWIYKTVIGSKGYQTIYGGPSGFEIEARNGSANETKFVPWNWGKPMASYELNKWNHCVFVHSDSDCKIYLNGEYIATGTAKASNPTGNYFIGAWNTSTQQNFEGQMSDFRIYATALSADDVKSLYQNCATIDPDGTIRGQIRS